MLVAPRLSRNGRSLEQQLCINSHDEDAITRSASLERAEPVLGSKMLDDCDGDGVVMTVKVMVMAMVMVR